MPIGAVHVILAALLVAGAGTGALVVSHMTGATGTCTDSSTSSTSSQSLHVFDDANETENETEIDDSNDTGSGTGQSGCDSGSSSGDSNITDSARSY
jgi:hypothetical protein